MKLSNEKDTEILNINLFKFNSTNIIEKIDNDICESEFNESFAIESESNNSLGKLKPKYEWTENSEKWIKF